MIDEDKAGRYLDEIRSLHTDNDRLERQLAARETECEKLRIALGRLSSPSWVTNNEQDMLSADTREDTYLAARSTIEGMIAIAREALSPPKSEEPRWR